MAGLGAPGAGPPGMGRVSRPCWSRYPVPRSASSNGTISRDSGWRGAGSRVHYGSLPRARRGPPETHGARHGDQAEPPGLRCPGGPSAGLSCILMIFGCCRPLLFLARILPCSAWAAPHGSRKGGALTGNWRIPAICGGYLPGSAGIFPYPFQVHPAKIQRLPHDSNIGRKRFHDHPDNSLQS